MPSLTNPNNVSIVTGVAPAVHGIASNFFLDPATQRDHMVLDDTFLRGSTILAIMEAQGVRVAAVTAKNKLRKLLNHGLNSAICFSAERAGKCTGMEDMETWLGQKAPSQYSGPWWRLPATMG